MQIQQNIKQARVSSGKTQQEVADHLKIKRSTYANWEKNIEPDVTTLVNIAKFLDTTLADLMKAPEESFHERQLDKKNNKPQKNTVPFYDSEATASQIGSDMTPISAPAGTIDIGDLLHDSSSALRIYGNSMLPNYPPGCVVGLIKKSTGFIQPGEVYVIETRNERLLKRLFYKDDLTNSDTLVCVSDNNMIFDGGARHGKLAYPPFEVSREEIIKLFIVTGVIKRNANSVIIDRN